MLSNNVNNSNDPINNSQNIFHNNNNNKNNEISEHSKNFMNLNMKNPFENYIFLIIDNSYKNFGDADINDPFILKFDNVPLHNDNEQ